MSEKISENLKNTLYYRLSSEFGFSDFPYVNLEKIWKMWI
jgi:hypothetical protein